MEESKIVTLEMIAQRAGLARSTVCCALKGTGSISVKTRQRVSQLAEEMGYQPNLFASALVQQRTSQYTHAVRQSVAVFYCMRTPHYLGDRSGPEVDKHARLLGLEYTWFNLKEEKNLPALGRMLRARGFTGIILDMIMDDVNFDGFPWEHFSVVAAGRQIYEWPFDVVHEGTGSTLRHALQKAYSLGYRKPGVCLYRHNLPVIDDRDRLGEALSNNYLTEGPVPPFFKPSPPPGCPKQVVLDYEAALRRWFSEYRPDVVIGFTISYMYTLRSGGYKVPQDTGYIALILDLSDPWQQEVCGYEDSARAVMLAALDRLSFLIRNNRRGIQDSPVEIIINSRWVDGKTLPDKTQDIPSSVGQAG